MSPGQLASERPFRAPHHTISPSGLVGGGPSPRPGEITLAHRGVLFLDELAEFTRPALEALRQPLEDGRVEITRGQRTIVFPAAAMLVAACNACPCARTRDECICTDADRARYSRRLSGPLLDRIDLVCHLAPPAPLSLVSEEPEAHARSVAVHQRVVAAREAQRQRLRGTGALCNGEMDPRLTRRQVRLDSGGRARLLAGHERTSLTARGHDRVLRLARTIADLAWRPRVEARDLDEALGFRLTAASRTAA